MERLWVFAAALTGSLLAPPGAPAEELLRPVSLFNWDLISLEQNNPRFNGSVLTGFHSVRSPGVTPYRAWKAGLGLLYTREEQVSTLDGRRFDRNQVIANPKLNYGFLPRMEAGVGMTAGYATGHEVVAASEVRRENAGVSSVDFGAKWNFLDRYRFRLAFSFDTRLAVDRRKFGNIPGNIFNVELDADYAVTPRFSMVGNLQFLASDSDVVREQAMADIAATYSFTDRFRGMLFGTVQEDEAARTVLGFVGIAGQYVMEQHSFTIAFDLQLNNATRDLRTEKQFDVEISYTFTF